MYTMSTCTVESLQQQQEQQQHSNVNAATQFESNCNNDNGNSGNNNSQIRTATAAATATEILLLNRVSAEIERMRMAPTTNGNTTNTAITTSTTATTSEIRRFHSFPPACLEMLTSIKGNHRCVDCGEQNPQWAACRYGALLCLQCSGQHRSYGVQISSVRSISMDEWSVNEVISMLEGGNSQLSAFFERHALTEQSCTINKTNGRSNDEITTNRNLNGDASLSSSTTTTTASVINKENVTRLRYKTKAASFYRVQMEQHVHTILTTGPYRGREVSRQNYK
jgi:Putative GTPase activating protein for Arf